jgi:sugar phosphate isomerase/epimerase
MHYFNRRDFLKTSSLAALACSMSSFGYKKEALRLSFSTLGCPDWTFQQVLDFAVVNKYTGIELRGIQRQLDLTKCNEFSNAQNIASTKRMMKDKGLQFVDLGSSCALHHTGTAEREKNLDEGKRFIDLAQEIDCPYIRVFPNNLPKEGDRNAVIDLITKGLLELGEYAKNSNVTVLMETHGDLVYTKDIVTVMQAATHAHTGLVWDIVNMWSVTKEPPATVYPQLKKYIHHTHIKDLKMVDGKEQYVLLGKGETPVFEGVDLLRKDDYKGYYSFEWEKLWHPEIADPEIALADYPKAIRAHIAQQ